MTKVICLLALLGLFIFCKVLPSLGSVKGSSNGERNGRNEFYRSNSDGDVTLEDEQEDHTIEEEIEKLGDLHGYFKNSEAHQNEMDRSPQQQVSFCLLIWMHAIFGCALLSVLK